MTETTTTATTSTAPAPATAPTSGTPAQNQTSQPNLSFDLDAIVKALPELSGEPSLANFKDIPSLAKSYVHAAKKLGVDEKLLLRLNADGSPTPEALKALGKPDKYEWPAETKSAFPDDFKKNLLSEFDRLNLTKAQAEGLIMFNDKVAQEMTIAGTKKLDAARTEAAANLKKTLGEAYDQTINFAKDALEVTGHTELWKTLEETGLNLNPEFMQFLGEIGRAAGEDRVASANTGGGSGSFKLTPAQARAEINRLRSDENFMKGYMNGDSPAFKDARERMGYLYRAVNGEN